MFIINTNTHTHTLAAAWNRESHDGAKCQENGSGDNISYSEFLSEYQIYFPREGDNPRAAGEWGYRLRGENKCADSDKNLRMTFLSHAKIDFLTK